MANGDIPPKPPQVTVLIVENAHASTIDIPCASSGEASTAAQRIWELVKHIREDYIPHGDTEHAE